ncbi:hemolysin family protein [Oscillochloris sp. ZM17-4]|uniref:hemolysin family protein n=1 Tax=Oscillochloris sp. ZM17-4 TaxID=2866714 RepID=UPI001C73B6DF|nr:hemolysin family protein [Oscillochloris sp. ZM17-4]MBX0327267.1 hemolysin family protein [Oscillochloris sp. ZM17-4]
MIELLIIVVLSLANGIFAATEIAMVSARRGRLEQRAEDGSAGAEVALKLQDDPNRFLSAVQVGITLIGTLSGVFAGATLADQLAPTIATLPYIGPYAIPLAQVLVVILVSYLSLVLGELVPKRLALQSAEAVAAFMAPPMSLLARFSTPVISVLSFSSDLILRILGRANVEEERVTEEDIRALVREGTEGGTVELQEQQFIDSIFKLTDRAVRHIMTPRHDVEMLDADATLGDVIDELLSSGYSRFPIYEGSPDTITGTVHVRDLLLLYRRQGEDAKVREAISPPLYVPENSRASALLATFRKGRRHMALVVSELGGIEGVVTLEDVLEEIVGEIGDEFDEIEAPPVTIREDGSMLADGSLNVDEVKRILDEDDLPDEETYRFDTLAGFVISLLGQIPTTGDVVSWGGWRFEVIDMDGLRVDKVLISRESGVGGQESGV